MKILFINLPYFGHVVPTIGLVQELIKLGCQVTYMLPFDWEEKISESGAEFAGYQNHPKLSIQIQNAYGAAEKLIDDYDLIIYEQFFFLGKHLAEKYHKSVVRIFTAPVTNEKLMREYIDAGGALGIFRHKWIGRMWTKEAAKGISLKTDCWLDEIVKNPPKLNLVYTLEEYQPYAEEFPKEQYRFLGASVYERKEEKFELVKQGRPVVYISLGTIVKGAKSFFKKCINAFKGEDVTVIMSVGKNFKIHCLGEIPENFFVYQTVPQLSVLEQADVFVSHGGMNSVSEALMQGVPMVVIPFMADQPTNARRITELGLGVRMDYRTLSSETLRETVMWVMREKTITENMNHMQKKMAQCPGNTGGAKMILEYYLKNYVATNCDSGRSDLRI